MSEGPFPYKIEKSAVVTVLGIILLFSTAILVTLLAPNYVDPSWHEPTSSYMVQMYKVADPNLYISSLQSGSDELQAVYHLKEGECLIAISESERVRILSEPKLEKYVTRFKETPLKLTSRVLLLQKPKDREREQEYKKTLQEKWTKDHPDGQNPPFFEILEVFEPETGQGFAISATDRIAEDWIEENYTILDPKQEWHTESGVIYVSNPMEYRIERYTFSGRDLWRFNAVSGKKVESLEELKSLPLGFLSRKHLIENGEHIYAIEGCWYCHTDQTRTLVQDVVLNGSDSFPAPPSTANEYIYQKITFPGTRRIGPDMSRVGVKRPSRDWHKSHFWAPKTQSRGSIMPAFKHFFDDDPRGTTIGQRGIPNYQFESIFQYLMTKGTRINPPTEAWWLGKDPVKTIELIEGKKG